MHVAAAARFGTYLGCEVFEVEVARRVCDSRVFLYEAEVE